MEDIRNNRTGKHAGWLCTGVCVCVSGYVPGPLKCLHKCWFCSSKSFNSAFSLPLCCSPHQLSSLHRHAACLLALYLNSSDIPFHYPFCPIPKQRNALYHLLPSQRVAHNMRWHQRSYWGKTGVWHLWDSYGPADGEGGVVCESGRRR